MPPPRPAYLVRLEEVDASARELASRVVELEDSGRLELTGAAAKAADRFRRALVALDGGSPVVDSVRSRISPTQ